MNKIKEIATYCPKDADLFHDKFSRELPLPRIKDMHYAYDNKSGKWYKFLDSKLTTGSNQLMQFYNDERQKSIQRSINDTALVYEPTNTNNLHITVLEDIIKKKTKQIQNMQDDIDKIEDILRNLN
jgi:hypothetical protein